MRASRERPTKWTFKVGRKTGKTNGVGYMSKIMNAFPAQVAWFKCMETKEYLGNGAYRTRVQKG